MHLSWAAMAAASMLACAAAAAEAPVEFKLELGPVPHFATEADAQSACRPDGVVWADSYNGFYYPKFLPGYGNTKFGTYTCFLQARKADYWSLTPGADGEGHKGREFPLRDCDSCS